MNGVIVMGGIIVLLVAIALLVVGVYNGLVAKRNRYKNAYAQIDVQLKRRHDLIPNLVETAKRYLNHERETLETVIRARNSAVTAAEGASAKPGDPVAMRALSHSEGVLTASLGRLFALSESYPDLKGNAAMAQLSEELTSTENRVAFARQAYNDSVAEYNTSRDVFPAVVFAGMFGFEAAGQLDVIEQPEERQAPRISLE